MNFFRIGRLSEIQIVAELDRVGFNIDDHQPRRKAVDDEQNFIEADRLARVNFAARRRVESPDDFFFRRDLSDVLHARE